MKYVIGVDIGTQSTKCLLVGVDGRVRAQAGVAYQPETPITYFMARSAAAA